MCEAIIGKILVVDRFGCVGDFSIVLLGYQMHAPNFRIPRKKTRMHNVYNLVYYLIYLRQVVCTRANYVCQFSRIRSAVYVYIGFDVKRVISCVRGFTSSLPAYPARIGVSVR